MNYAETLEFLFTKLPMFTRIGAAAYKANLNNITALCEALNNPQNNFKSIHIAGTNGKGSTSSMLASILQQHNYTVGLFTSPHITDFRERIRINGVMVSQDWVVEFVNTNLPLIEKLQPSFFEITTAMVFTKFAESKVDIAVIEVGMGGLLDSTNIILPELCIITNIGMDHTQFLGNTLAEIAINKAGIIKPNVPVIISETHEATEAVFVQTANKQKAPIYFADAIYDAVIKTMPDHSKQISLVHKGKMEISKYVLDLQGNYQQKNLKAVILACDVLQNLGYALNQNSIATALQNVRANTGIAARFEIVSTKPYLILDVAHNTEGIKLVMQQINEMQFKNLHIVLGFVADKDVSNVLQLLPKNATYYFTQAQIPRALNFELLQEKATEAGLKGSGYKNVNEALKVAKLNAIVDDIILVCGSFFIIAEIEKN